jgi:hypothetical protein
MLSFSGSLKVLVGKRRADTATVSNMPSLDRAQSWGCRVRIEILGIESQNGSQNLQLIAVWLLGAAFP